MNIIVVFLAIAVGVTTAQFFEPFAAQTLSFAIQPPPVQQNTFQPTFNQDLVAPPPVAQIAPAAAPKRVLAHRAVVVNAENEARLPPELLNPFYKNPRIAQALAKESWFGPGEEQVVNREAEKIPRQQIVKLLKQAGFARR